MKECIFCEPSRSTIFSNILFENELAIVVPDNFPVSQGHLLIIPKEHFENWFAYFQKGLSEHQVAEADGLMPSLLKSYMKLGAQVACEPAFDEEFDCIDLLTILRKEDLAQSLANRFQVVR